MCRSAGAFDIYESNISINISLLTELFLALEELNIYRKNSPNIKKLLRSEIIQQQYFFNIKSRNCNFHLFVQNINF